MREIEHEDEIGRAVGWRRRWFCPRCTYRIDSADRDAISAHKNAHLRADREAEHEARGS